MSPNQMRHFGVDVDDKPIIYKGRQSMIVGDHEIPFEFKNGLLVLHTWKPTEDKLKSSPVLILTSDAPWNPNEVGDGDMTPATMWTHTLSEDKEIINDAAHSIIAKIVKRH